MTPGQLMDLIDALIGREVTVAEGDFEIPLRFRVVDGNVSTDRVNVGTAVNPDATVSGRTSATIVLKVVGS